MHVFKHPKYYEELRKKRKKFQQEERERNAKEQATSTKVQATSVKLQDPRATVKFHGALTKGLDHDKCIVWMLHMKADLVW